MPISLGKNFRNRRGDFVLTHTEQHRTRKHRCAYTCVECTHMYMYVHERLCGFLLGALYQVLNLYLYLYMYMR